MNKAMPSKPFVAKNQAIESKEGKSRCSIKGNCTNALPLTVDGINLLNATFLKAAHLLNLISLSLLLNFDILCVIKPYFISINPLEFY